jgi:riboflavin kinase/FMN adenylyltransferase
MRKLKIFNGIETVTAIKDPVVTIGTFDGVHLGHQRILMQLKEEAESIEGETVLITFYPHPREVLFPENHGLQLLQTMEEKIQILEQFGLDNLIIIPFNENFSKLTASEFVEGILIGNLMSRKIVIGYDHQFGRNREGNLLFLQSVAEKYGYEVIEIPAKSIEEINISSTKIRESLLRGNVETAKLFLSRPYSISGIVIEGQKLGRKLGFPTANIALNSDTKLVPADGVYAVKIEIEGVKFAGVMNIGHRPTVDSNSKKTLEVFILDFDNEIYGKQITVFFEKHIRNEQKFANLDDLKKAISHDEVICRQFFNLPIE